MFAKTTKAVSTIPLLLLGGLGFGEVAGSAEPLCSRLPAPAGNIIEVTAAQAGSLPGISYNAKTGDTILLHDGIYDLGSGELVLRSPGVTLRSKSGNRQAVVLDGGYVSGEILRIYSSDAVVADITLQRAYSHPIHVYGSAGDVRNTLIHNVHVKDGGAQGIKINPGNGYFTDYGTIRCSHIELTDAGRPYVRNNCYVGGIDAHQSRGWTIQNNLVEGFWCPSGLAEHGIHLWTGSRDTLVERNTLRNNARGIGLGLGQSTAGRSYADNPCEGRSPIGHFGGMVRNNFIFVSDDRVFDSANGMDLGIGLEQACGTQVVHNTVVSLRAPRSNSIEWRFPNSVVTLANNLTSHAMNSRDGASASRAGDAAFVSFGLFSHAPAGDLHLSSGATEAIDTGAYGFAVDDIDGEARDGNPDKGADEYASGAVQNAAPRVDAGSDKVLVAFSGNLTGSVSDDGLPNPPGLVSTQWSVDTGPAPVTFSDSAHINTGMGFSREGIYVLRLTASDGALSAFDNVTVTVSAPPSGDSSSPSAPASVTFSEAQSTALVLSWYGSTDNAGVTGYLVDVSSSSSFASYVTGYRALPVGAVTRLRVTGLLPQRSYYARVRAMDAAGNLSSYSAVAIGKTRKR